MAHRNRWFTYQKWWFSMAMLNNQMVNHVWWYPFLPHYVNIYICVYLNGCKYFLKLPKIVKKSSANTRFLLLTWQVISPTLQTSEVKFWRPCPGKLQSHWVFWAEITRESVATGGSNCYWILERNMKVSRDGIPSHHGFLNTNGMILDVLGYLDSRKTLQGGTPPVMFVGL